uniref:Uncharacterized protein n=1 Tax=Setaria digitata TaxID=48799 RepID=A0A915PXT8_9BILA
MRTMTIIDGEACSDGVIRVAVTVRIEVGAYEEGYRMICWNEHKKKEGSEKIYRVSEVEVEWYLKDETGRGKRGDINLMSDEEERARTQHPFQKQFLEKISKGGMEGFVAQQKGKKENTLLCSENNFRFFGFFTFKKPL